MGHGRGRRVVAHEERAQGAWGAFAPVSFRASIIPPFLSAVLLAVNPRTQPQEARQRRWPGSNGVGRWHRWHRLPREHVTQGHVTALVWADAEDPDVGHLFVSGGQDG